MVIPRDVDNIMMLLCLTSLSIGSPYEMGYAHGQLMQERAKSMMNDVWSYLEDQVVCIILLFRLLRKGSIMLKIVLNTNNTDT